jgi:hypothetical protein
MSIFWPVPQPRKGTGHQHFKPVPIKTAGTMAAKIIYKTV